MVQTMIEPPHTDAQVADYVRALGLPGLADIHIHFLPEPMLVKVWEYFDQAEDHYGMSWPITYRYDETTRLQILDRLGVRAIPALTYPHKPGMARWLNDWCRDFAARVPNSVHCATLYPEPDVGDYVREALDAGARLFKMHVQVGSYAPDDPLLDPAWAALQQARAPVVIHCGSGPIEGAFTGAGRVRRVLDRYPALVLVIAHAGMPEYDEFASIARDFENVHLDTTMVATDFTERFAPLPAGSSETLLALQDKVVLGSDFPNIPYPYAHQIEALARLGLGDDWMRSVLWHNGARLMGLS